MSLTIHEWIKEFDRLVEFMDSNGRLPLFEVIDERGLFRFMAKNQFKKYNKEPEMWDELCYDSKHAPLFVASPDEYRAKIAPLVRFVEEHERKPKRKHKEERPLLWLWRRMKRRFFYGFYTNPEAVFACYVEFLRDPRISPHFGHNMEGWLPRLEALVMYVVSNENQLPPSGSKMRKWYDYQMRNCHASNPLYPLEVSERWEDFLSSSIHEAIESSDDEDDE